MPYNYNWENAFQKARDGNRKLLDRHIKEAYQTVLFPFVKKKSGSSETAKEVCISVVSKFWEKFYVMGEKLPNNVNGYMYIMAKNALLHYMKTKEKQRKKLVFLEEEKLHHILESSLNTPSKYSEEKEMLYISLNKAFGKIGERCKELLEMNIIEKKTIRKIAPIMGFPSENAATQKKVSCIKKMRKLIYYEIRNQSK